MELTEYTPSAPSKQLSGQQNGIVVDAGESFAIETSPGGEEVLGATVPVGKQWIVSVCVDIREEDS